MPFLLSDLLSTKKRLRLSIGNEEEVLRGDQGMETKKRILAARNRLLHKINKLSFFNHCTYESSVVVSTDSRRLPLVLNI